MGFFTALMTYLVSAALLVGGMVTGFAVFLAQSPEAGLTAKPRPPLVRANDRKAAESPKAMMSPQSAVAPSAGPAVNHMPANPPQLKAAEQAKQLTGQPARKKKVAKPAPAPPPPREPDAPKPDGATLGYGPSEPRKFIFPLDPGW